MKKGSVVASLDATLLLRKRFSRDIQEVAYLSCGRASGNDGRLLADDGRGDRGGDSRDRSPVDRISLCPLSAGIEEVLELGHTATPGTVPGSRPGIPARR